MGGSLGNVKWEASSLCPRPICTPRHWAKAGLLSLSTIVPAARRVLQESREVLRLGIQTQEEDATY